MISDMNDRVQVFLEGQKDELSNLGTDVSSNIHWRQVEKKASKRKAS